MPSIPRSALFAVAGLVVALAIAAAICAETGLDGRLSTDLVAACRSDANARFFFQTVTHLGSRWALFPISGLIALAVWLVARRPGLAGLFAGAMLTTAVLNEVVKLIVRRARPDGAGEFTHADGYSFPSGHAMSSAAAYGLLAWLLLLAVRGTPARVAIVIGATVLVALIAFSRVYLGVHFPSDVLTGAAVGLAVVGVTAWMYDRNRPSARNDLGTTHPAGESRPGPLR